MAKKPQTQGLYEVEVVFNVYRLEDDKPAKKGQKGNKTPVDPEAEPELFFDNISAFRNQDYAGVLMLQGHFLDSIDALTEWGLAELEGINPEAANKVKEKRKK